MFDGYVMVREATFAKHTGWDNIGELEERVNQEALAPHSIHGEEERKSQGVKSDSEESKHDRRHGPKPGFIEHSFRSPYQNMQSSYKSPNSIRSVPNTFSPKVIFVLKYLSL